MLQIHKVNERLAVRGKKKSFSVSEILTKTMLIVLGNNVDTMWNI